MAKLREDFGVPEDHEPIGVVALGHSAETEASPGSSARSVARRNFDDVVRFGHW